MDVDVLHQAKQAALRAAVAALELEQALQQLADTRPEPAFREGEMIRGREFLTLDFSDAGAAWGMRYTALLADVVDGGLLLWMTSSDAAMDLRAGKRVTVARGRVLGNAPWALQQRIGRPVVLPRLQNVRLL